MTDSSKTAANSARTPGKPFTKGDARINRKGRPRTFDALRELARQIAHEPVKTKDGQPVVVDGRGVTTAEMILRMWAGSPDFRKQQGFMEIAFGKVPNPIDITSAGQAIVVIGLGANTDAV